MHFIFMYKRSARKTLEWQLNSIENFVCRRIYSLNIICDETKKYYNRIDLNQFNNKKFQSIENAINDQYFHYYNDLQGFHNM